MMHSIVAIKIKVIFVLLQKKPPEVFDKKGALRKFAKFTGKHLYQGLKSDLRRATLL